MVQLHQLHESTARVGVVFQAEWIKSFVIQIAAEGIEQLHFEPITKFRQDALLEVEFLEAAEGRQQLRHFSFRAVGDRAESRRFRSTHDFDEPPAQIADIDQPD